MSWAFRQPPDVLSMEQRQAAARDLVRELQLSGMLLPEATDGAFVRPPTLPTHVGQQEVPSRV